MLRWGVVGFKARQIKLDEQDRVLYSVPDTTFQRTGSVSGFGYPEIVCDNQHASIILPFLGAAMRKIAKTSKERDRVQPEYLRLVKFCDGMLAATTASEAELDNFLTEDRGSTQKVDNFHILRMLVAVVGCMGRWSKLMIVPQLVRSMMSKMNDRSARFAASVRCKNRELRMYVCFAWNLGMTRAHSAWLMPLRARSLNIWTLPLNSNGRCAHTVCRGLPHIRTLLRILARGGIPWQRVGRGLAVRWTWIDFDLYGHYMGHVLMISPFYKPIQHIYQELVVFKRRPLAAVGPKRQTTSM